MAGFLCSSTTADKTSSEMTQTQVERFLIGKKLALCGFTWQVEQKLDFRVEKAGGEIPYMDFDGVLDYLVLPPDGLTTSQKASQRAKANRKAKEIVSSFWLEDSLDKGELCPIDYYHRPIEHLDGDDQCCQGVVISISTYSGRERQFLQLAAESMGMISQEVFAKKDTKEAKRSTHLVCSEPSGNKYEHGIKWGLPIVNKDWLMACLAERKITCEKPFLVGDSKVYNESRPMPSDPRKALITTSDEVHAGSQLEDAFRQALECPICFNVQTQVVQCVNGHPICTQCQQGMQECPVCKVAYSAGVHRNRVAEELARALNNA